MALAQAIQPYLPEGMTAFDGLDGLLLIEANSGTISFRPEPTEGVVSVARRAAKLVEDMPQRWSAYG